MSIHLPKVYISIVNWNDFEGTIRCITALERQQYSNFEIVVVDNASINGSVEWIRTAFPDITIIQSEENLGFAGGSKCTVDLAIANEVDLVWIINTDIEFLDEDTLTALVEAYIEYGPFIFGSIQLLADDVSLVGENYYKPNSRFITDKHPISIHRHVSYEQQFPNKEPRETLWVHGSSIMVPVEIARAHGFMDIRLFLYMEEVEYCHRLAKLGVATYVVPKSKIVHKKHKTTNANPRLQQISRYYYVRNRLIYIRKYEGLYRYISFIIKNNYIQRFLKIFLKLFFVANYQEVHFTDYLQYLAVRDALLNRVGKTIAPEDYYE